MWDGKGTNAHMDATGNDLKNAIDIKEGMEDAGEIKNTKTAVAEIIPDTGI